MAAAPLPAVAVGRRARLLEDAVMAAMAGIRALGAAAEGVRQTTAAADKYVLEGNGEREGGGKGQAEREAGLTVPGGCASRLST